MMMEQTNDKSAVNTFGVLKPTEISNEQFQSIAKFIETNVGIKMPDSKKLMVQSRLYNRLKSLNMKNFEQYISYVFSNTPDAQEEIALMINAITTNLTHFFRESQHFDYMTQVVLPELTNKGIPKVELWSAGCSSGEEPYTLSIVMQEFISKNTGAIKDYRIYATDISSRVLGIATNAVYTMESIKDLDFNIKKKYFLKSKNPAEQKVRVNKDTRLKVTFNRLNFMDSVYPVDTQKHIIFCRNVLIYFDKPTQEAVIRKLVHNLVPGGYLFLGHSETIFGMDLPLENVGPTIFKKTE